MLVQQDLGNWDEKRWIMERTSLFFFFFSFGHSACGILVPLSGIKTVPPAAEAQSFNHLLDHQGGPRKEVVLTRLRENQDDCND